VLADGAGLIKDQAAWPFPSLVHWQAVAREPSPDEAAMFNELIDNLAQGLSERDGQILEFSLAGCEVSEIPGQGPGAARGLWPAVRHPGSCVWPFSGVE